VDYIARGRAATRFRADRIADMMAESRWLRHYTDYYDRREDALDDLADEFYFPSSSSDSDDSVMLYVPSREYRRGRTRVVKKLEAEMLAGRPAVWPWMETRAARWEGAPERRVWVGLCVLLGFLDV